MTIKDVLSIWDRLFPNNGYPESWVIRMWCQNYTTQELDHAAQVTALAAEDGRLRNPNDNALSRYMSGVLRKTKVSDAEVEAEIEKHLAERSSDVYISI